MIRPLAELRALAAAGRWGELTDSELDRLARDPDWAGPDLAGFTDADLAELLKDAE